MISAVNGRKRALLTKSALEWHNKRCTAQSTLCVGNKKGKTELKAMCDFKKKKKNFFFFFFLVSRYLGHDTIHVSPAQVSRCIDASMHRYALSRNSLGKKSRVRSCSMTLHVPRYPAIVRVASFLFGVYSWLVKVLGQFSIIYFRGLGLRIGVRVWVRVRVRVGVRVWVRVRVRVRVRVSVVLWSG